MELLLQEEKLKLCEKELSLLITTYWFDTPENEGHVPLEFDWPQYRTLEDQGICRIFTARNSQTGRMVGAAIYMVVYHPHHYGYKFADCDTLCTSRADRGEGIGTKLYEFCEEKLKAACVCEITHRARLVYKTQHLFPSLGFTAIETVYSKKVR